jgi:nucleoside-diphosphate-sugar epimerase
MAIMVTGGTGFVGSYLTRRLVEKGEEVVVFDWSPRNELISDVMKKIEFVRGDVSSFYEVSTAVRKNKITDIFHTASLLSGESQSVLMRATYVNAIGTVNILEAARMNGVNRVLYTSTEAVFGSDLGEIYDDTPKCPDEPYGAAKLFSELNGLFFHKEYGLDFRGVRFSLVYGAGDVYAYHARSRIIENPAIGLPVKLEHSEETMDDWLYVKDAVNALMLLYDTPAERIKKRIYNIGGGMHSWREVAHIVKKYVPDAQIMFDVTRSEMGSRTYDDRYARNELGWEPSYSLDNGVKETIDEAQKLAETLVSRRVLDFETMLPEDTLHTLLGRYR